MKKALSLLVSLTLALTMLAGSVTAVAEAALPVIKIASATPLSGSQAAMGETIKNGIELALSERVEEFKALGFDLQFAPQDDQADPKVGVSIAQRLIEGAFIVRFGMHIHVWRRFDSWFRLFTEISRPIAICWEVQLNE